VVPAQGQADVGLLAHQPDEPLHALLVGERLGNEWGRLEVRAQPAHVVEPVADVVAERLIGRDVGATPLGRVAEPGDMVGTLLYLLGPGAAFVSVRVVLVNGGRVAG
jgi:NAD(P)-dependent dehydrogenase (short-subunit alcohol dehydrogenase family)